MRETDAMRDARAVTLHRTGNGPPVVLLHCLGVDHRLWPIALAGMEREHTLLAYDFPGHGASPVPLAPYGIADLSAQLAAVLDRAGIARATLAGISLGGLVAQHFAVRHPARVDRLVLIDTTPCYTDELRKMWAVRAAQARQDGVGALIPGLLEIWFTKAFAAQDPPAVRYVRGALELCPGEGYARACEALAAADLRDLAAKIAAPTLVVCGEQDIPSFLDAARWLDANIANSRLAWLAPARHASILERPEAFRRALREFLV
ncbi:MAG: alpha/beta fold hydrolase [Stellaceae bacterium]